eukprot:472009-Prymnesium_polylepis.1
MVARNATQLQLGGNAPLFYYGRNGCASPTDPAESRQKLDLTSCSSRFSLSFTSAIEEIRRIAYGERRACRRICTKQGTIKRAHWRERARPVLRQHTPASETNVHVARSQRGPVQRGLTGWTRPIHVRAFQLKRLTQHTIALAEPPKHDGGVGNLVLTIEDSDAQECGVCFSSETMHCVLETRIHAVRSDGMRSEFGRDVRQQWQFRTDRAKTCHASHARSGKKNPDRACRKCFRKGHRAGDGTECAMAGRPLQITMRETGGKLPPIGCRESLRQGLL